jgi:hypothetical protein
MLGFGGQSCSEISSMEHNHMMNMETNVNRKFFSFPLSNNNSSGVQVHHNNYNQHQNNNNTSSNVVVRDKIMAHPLFPRLLSSYLNCLKVSSSSNSQTTFSSQDIFKFLL